MSTKKVVILKEGKETIVEVKKPKAKHVKKGFRLYTEIAKKDNDDLSALNSYLEYLDEMSSELSGMSVEELDDLDSEEKDKILSVLQESINGKIDFLKSSSKLASSEPKASQE